MNLILIQTGYPPAIITQKDRLKYLNNLEKAQLGGAIGDYLQLINSAVRRSLTLYLKALLQEELLSKSDVSTLLKIGALAKIVLERQYQRYILEEIIKLVSTQSYQIIVVLIR